MKRAATPTRSARAVGMRDGVDVDALDALEALRDALDASSRRSDDDDSFRAESSFRASMTPRGRGFHRALAMTIDDAPANARWIAVSVRLPPGATFDADEIRAATRASDGWTCETSGDADGERTSASASESALTCARRMIQTTASHGDERALAFAAMAHARYGATRPGGGAARIEIDFGAAATLMDGTTRVARARTDGIWDVPVGDASAVGRVRATNAAAQLAGAACALRAIRASTRRARTR